MTTTGPDVSSWQGSDIDWNVVRGAGNSFAFCKATEGTGYHDPTFNEGRRQAMHNAGFPLIGFYHFCHPHLHSPEDEANFFLSAVGSHRSGEIAILDVEAQGEIDYAAGDWCARWCDLVEAAGWPPVLIYGNGSDISAMNTLNLFHRPLWIAGFPNFTTLDRWSNYSFHQFSDNYNVPGIGPCDFSRSPLDDAGLAALGGGVVQDHPSVPVDPDPLHVGDRLLMRIG